MIAILFHDMILINHLLFKQNKATKEYEAYDELIARVSSLKEVLEPLKSKEKLEKDMASQTKVLENALKSSKEADEEYDIKEIIKNAFSSLN